MALKLFCSFAANRITMNQKQKNIAIFASGNGSNAQNIVEYFKDNKDVNIKLFLTNKKDAYVIERAKDLEIPCIVFTAKELRESNKIVDVLKEYSIDFIVLAGFLLRIPQNLIELFPNKIVNIHPALLPKYGGKGMYGDFVHQAVKEAGDAKTGITIHYVNEHYDEGQIVFQKEVELDSEDTPDRIAEKVHALEYAFFPKVIEDILYNKQL